MEDDKVYADLLPALSPLTSLGIDPDEAMLDRKGTMEKLLGANAAPQSWLEKAQASDAPPPPVMGRVQAPPQGNAVPAGVTQSGEATTATPNDPAAISRGLYKSAADQYQSLLSEPGLDQQTAPLQAKLASDQGRANASPYVPGTTKVQDQYRPSIAQRIARGVGGFARGGVFGVVDPTIGGGQSYGAPNQLYDTQKTQAQGDVAADQQGLAAKLATWKSRQEQTKANASDLGALAKTGLDIAKADKDGNTPDKLPEMYAQAVSAAMQRGDDPSKDPKVQQYADAITSLQRQPAPKEPARDDRAIQIYAKSPAERTPEENAYLKGYEHYVQVTKTDPGVARTSVLLNYPVAVADPDEPGGVRYTTRRDAIGQEAPSGIDTKTPQNVAKDFTTGTGAKTLTAFNTAQKHLDQLRSASTALKNGNLKALNAIANEYGVQTGKSAPLVFQAVKTALTGELGKAFSGAGATVTEQAELAKTINAANGPEANLDVANTYDHLLKSKKDALRSQYESGMKGKANFGNNAPAVDPLGIR